jgi:hypothetical protein
MVGNATKLSTRTFGMDSITTTTAPVRSPAFHTDDPPEVSEYRTISALAIVALVFGLAAPLCFWAPFLMVIPLVGAGLSIVAQRRITASDGALTGRGVALAALALSLASATASISHDRVTRHLQSKQAEVLARQWISLLLNGNTQVAFGLTVDGSRPPAPPGPGEPPPKETPFEAFTKNPVVKALIGAGPNSNIRFERISSYTPLSSHQVVLQQEYSISPAASPNSQSSNPVGVVLDLQRSRLAGENNLHWLVLSFRDPNTPANPALSL